MSYTVTQILQIANVSQFLAADDEVKKNFLSNGFIRPGLSRLIYIVKNAVSWLNTYNSSSGILYGQANYLLSLCQPYVGKALQIIGSGGAGTIINPATGIISTIVSNNVEFTIGSAGSLMNPGDTSLVLPYAFILNSSIIVSLDGVDLPIGATDRISFTPVYTILNSTIIFNAPVQIGQLYNIKFLQYISL